VRAEVRKAVITAAGWGTRFLPATKAQPKEMLPLVDRPLIQYAVEEVIASGLRQVILVTAQGKRALEDYFDHSFELEALLKERGETRLWEEVRRLSNMVDMVYVRQKQMLGLGHAVLTARGAVGEEPFALVLPDDVFEGPVPLIAQLLEVRRKYGGSILAVERVPGEEVSRYGIIKAKPVAERVYEVLDLVEKPPREEAPSDLAIIGRYILEPAVFPALEATHPGRGGEIQLTDGLRLLPRGRLFALEFQGQRYDAGTPLSWLKATMALALRHPEWGTPLREYLRQLLRKK